MILTAIAEGKRTATFSAAMKLDAWDILCTMNE